MNYFFDVQFHENFHKPWFGRRRHFIDVISIGIVAEDGRTLYLVNKDFDVKAAWNSWQPRTGQGDRNNTEPKHYWLRENVLWHIYKDWADKANIDVVEAATDFNLKNFQNSLNLFGFHADDFPVLICEFVDARYIDNKHPERGLIFPGADTPYPAKVETTDVNFYSYYSHYGWVALCSMFGRMQHLPKGFPMYAKDLKQMLDEKLCTVKNSDFITKFHVKQEMTLAEKAIEITKHTQFPEYATHRHALENAKWNLHLYNFIKKFPSGF